MRVRRQPEHHGDAAVVVQRRAEDAAAAALRLVVVLDVVEQQRRAGAGALRQPHDGAELDVPIDLGVDLVQLARRAQRVDPAAQIAELRSGLRSGVTFDPQKKRATPITSLPGARAHDRPSLRRMRSLGVRHVLLNQERRAAIEFLILLMPAGKFSTDQIPGKLQRRDPRARRIARRGDVASRSAATSGDWKSSIEDGSMMMEPPASSRAMSIRRGLISDCSAMVA